MSILATCFIVFFAIFLITSLWHLQWPPSVRRLCAAIFVGICIGILSIIAGLHMCFEGTPPLLLSGVFAATGAASILYQGKKWVALTLRAGICFAAVLMPMTLAGLYHRPDITGNPNFASDTYWHTFFTGILPRDYLRYQRAMGKRNKFRTDNNSPKLDKSS